MDEYAICTNKLLLTLSRKFLHISRQPCTHKKSITYCINYVKSNQQHYERRQL